jgi:hypothetical protein
MSSAELHLGQIMTLLGGSNQRIYRLDERSGESSGAWIW